MGESSWLDVEYALGVLCAIIPVWIAFTIYVAREIGDAEKCKTQRDVCENGLNVGRWGRYRGALQALLDRIDHFFGFRKPDEPPSNFLKPWSRCLQIAFFYPLFFFVTAYVFAARGDLGGVDILDGDLPAWRRLAFTVWMFVTFGFFYIAFKKDWFERFGRYIADAFRKGNGKVLKKPSIEKAVLWFVENTTFVFAGAVAFAGAGVGAFASVGAGAGADTAAFAFAFAGAFAGAGVVAGFVVGFGIVVVSGAGADAIFFLSLFVLFPAVNSLLDWVSIVVTRALMQKWAGEDRSVLASLVLYISGTFFDIIFSIICICILSILLAAAAVGLNFALQFLSGDEGLSFDWFQTMQSFRDDPWGDGLMVTLMLFSTLVPTIFHLMAGTAACFVMPNIRRDYVVRALAGGPPDVMRRLKIGFVATAVPALFLVIWTVVFGLLFRFFVPLSWISFIPGVPSEGTLLIWLPYAAAEWTWVALGGALP